MPKRAALPFSKLRAALLLASALTLAGCGDSQPSSSSGREIGLYTSLPIVWGESGDIRELLEKERPRHWALAVLSSAGTLHPLDTVTDRLPRDALLVLAQPRPLSPQENVALDRWVREGGRVLLFADPLLTAPTRYALGDPRRPQDTVLLSPILARWGLRLEFDEAQPAGEHLVETALGPLPVNLAGRFRLLGNSGESASSPGFSGKHGTVGDHGVDPGKSGIMGTSGDAPGRCHLEAEGVLARCSVEKGRVFAVSDAAVLEKSDDPASIALRRNIFSTLIGWAETGD
ncbi:MAG: ABC transporter [Novosphingobium sp.]|nr:ABC transporter [Novosphingobium sp.]